MKKILFFALALVAGVMAFSSCDGKNGNNPESQIIDPKNVTAEDIIGEWRQDSAFGDYQTGAEYHRRPFMVTKDHIEGEWGVYTLKDGILSINIHERDWGQVEEVYIDRQVELEIVSFDKGLKRAVLKQKDVTFIIYDEEPPYAEHEVKGECTYYFSMLPEPSGKDLEVTEENVKGVWFEEYDAYGDGDHPLAKSVTPHYNFDYFGDDHEYMNLMAVELNPLNAFPHPGFWKFHDGGLEYVEAYGGQSYDDMSWGNYNFYKIEKLTDKFMVLHATWDEGKGHQYYYMSRTNMKKEDLENE